jgi:hypothetical protein
MMIELREKILSAMQDERRFSALTGVSVEKFKVLWTEFSNQAEKKKNAEYKRNPERKRRPGGGKKGLLETNLEKIFFILFYLKNYNSADTLGFIFNMGTSTVIDNVKHIFPIFMKTLNVLNVLPCRRFNSLPQFIKVTEYTAKIILDVTERCILRPSQDAQQRKHYSGKKKGHRVKNLTGINAEGAVFYVGRTAPGSVHDYTLMKQAFNPEIDWFEGKEALFDLGFQGVKTDYRFPENTRLPYKKPRKSKHNPNPSLTKKQKQYNRELAQERIAVEHAFAGMKVFRILTEPFRNRVKNFIDEVFVAVAGLYNLKKGFSLQ